MFWPISPVTLTEFFCSHALQKRHHLSPPIRLMSRVNTVNVSLEFGKETAIFSAMFRYSCSRLPNHPVVKEGFVTTAAHREK
jgi:hypothetical protein